MELKTTLNLIKIENTEKIIVTLLTFSMLIMIDFIVVYLLAKFVNILLLMSLLSFLTFFSYIYSRIKLKSELKGLQAEVSNSNVPRDNFYLYFGSCFSSLFLIIPGFCSFLIGSILNITFVRKKIGKKISKKMDIDISEIYEYLKLYEINL